ncbi:D-amino-acid oxidase [Penicillium malachiteum]|uniref:D-amino-acid oxidase n=1 Tax=Penicillium malachiteum TaxID=1324776 RepID=UPI002548D98C|nr:D-amino-acid oxidase [Penicillium malachiteum]KAJ5720721.1 D-amino-acid oxidase [Penicillium malachiteum]
MNSTKNATFLNTDVVVIGAGVIGLTAARGLLLKGFKVTVLAKHVPGDEDIYYASNWAGAMWAGEAKTSEERRLLLATYGQLMRFARTEPDAAVHIVRIEERFHENPLLGDPTRLWLSEFVEDFRIIEPRERRSDDAFICSYSLPVVDSPVHLQWLKSQVTSLGGEIKRQDIVSLSEIYAAYPQSTVIVNASGLGARTLDGVNDPKCHPVRGQTILVRSDQTSTLYYHTQDEQHTYIIPRPGSKLLVCGGVFQPGRDSPLVDEVTRMDEIRRTNLLAPHVVSKNPEIVANIVGIRPGREGGYRLEHEIRQGSKSKIHILHAYGHGHNGYSISYGTADALVAMVSDLHWESAVKPRQISL